VLAGVDSPESNVLCSLIEEGSPTLRTVIAYRGLHFHHSVHFQGRNPLTSCSRMPRSSALGFLSLSLSVLALSGSLAEDVEEPKNLLFPYGPDKKASVGDVESPP